MNKFRTLGAGALALGAAALVDPAEVRAEGGDHPSSREELTQSCERNLENIGGQFDTLERHQAQSITQDVSAVVSDELRARLEQYNAVVEALSGELESIRGQVASEVDCALGNDYLKDALRQITAMRDANGRLMDLTRANMQLVSRRAALEEKLQRSVTPYSLDI